MSGNMCHKKAPETEFCPENFKKDLFKMKLDGLNNPKYYLNKGSVMIQVESQVVSRFRPGFDSSRNQRFNSWRTEMLGYPLVTIGVSSAIVTLNLTLHTDIIIPSGGFRGLSLH